MSKTDSNQHQDNEIPPITAGDLFLFLLLTGAMITPGILSPDSQNILSFIAISVDIIIFFRLTTYLIKNKKQKTKNKKPKTKRAILAPLIYPASISFLSLPAIYILARIYITLVTDNLELDWRILSEPTDIYTYLLFTSLISCFVYTCIAFACLQKSPYMKLKDTPPEVSDNPPKKQISFFPNPLKLLVSLPPILAIIVYISALRSNLDPASGDIGLAIHITSIQFSENKSDWITQVSIIIFTVYIISLPAFIIPRIKDFIDSSQTLSTLIHKYARTPITFCNILVSASTVLTLLVTIFGISIFSPFAKENIVQLSISLPFASFFLCTLPICFTLYKNFWRYTPDNDLKLNANEIILYCFAGAVLLFYSIFSFKILFVDLPYTLGKAIVSPGETLGSSGTAYDCVFSTDPKSRESIAFGIVAETKPDSIHVFTPTYDYQYRAYGKKLDNGNIRLNKLTESQLKIPTGYNVEKFNKNKHYYDVNTGKCTHLAPLDFYESTQPGTKLTIRNIS